MSNKKTPKTDKITRPVQKPNREDLLRSVETFQNLTSVQRKLWLKTAKLRGEVAEGTRPASAIFADLFTTLVIQRLTQHYRGAPDLMSVYGKEQWTNSLIEYISQSLYAVQTESELRKTVAISDFGADDNEFKSLVVQADQVRLIKLVMPANGFVDIFANPRTLEAFTAGRLSAMSKTWDYHFFTEKMKILLEMANSALTLDYDKEINLGTVAEFQTDEQIVAGLEKIRVYIKGLQTPSKDHLKLNREKWVYSASPEDLVMVINTKFAARIKSLTARLYHPDDVLFKVKRVAIDFSKVKGAIATDTDKIKCLILDKQALRFGSAMENFAKHVVLPSLDDLMIVWNWYGFAQLKNFAIAKVFTS